MLIKEESEGPCIDSAGLKREGPNSSASEPSINVLNPRPRDYYILAGRTGIELFEQCIKDIVASYEIRHEGQKVDSGAEVGLDIPNREKVVPDSDEND